MPIGAHKINTIGRHSVAAPTVTVTGGTITDSGGYRYHTFTSSDATGLSISGGSKSVSYILVAGGGAGGGATSGDAGHGGGGGAGGVITGNVTLGTGNYPVIIGAGGTAGANTYPASRFGNPSTWSLKSATAPLTIHLLNGYRRQPVAAANGQNIWLSSASPTAWQSYQNLPSYLLDLPCTVEIELSNTTQFSTNKSTKVYLMRDPTWANTVDLTGWSTVESSKNYITTLTNLTVYSKTFAAGTHTIDSLSGVYFFEDTEATPSEYVYCRGGGYGGTYSTNTNGIQARGGSGGSGGGSGQKGSWHSSYTPNLSGDYGSVGITGQGNTGGWQYTDNRTLCDPGCNNQNYTPVSGTGGGGAGARAAANALTAWTRQYSDGQYYPEVGVKGGGGGAGIQWLNGSYYGGGGGGATTYGAYIGETRTGLATYTDGVLQQPGGLGGGGNGRYNFSNTTKVYCTAGTANTGGGGGGAGPSSVDGTGGGAGGSGILIVRYAI